MAKTTFTHSLKKICSFFEKTQKPYLVSILGGGVGPPRVGSTTGGLRDPKSTSGFGCKLAAPLWAAFFLTSKNTLWGGQRPPCTPVVIDGTCLNQNCFLFFLPMLPFFENPLILTTTSRRFFLDVTFFYVFPLAYFLKILIIQELCMKMPNCGHHLIISSTPPLNTPTHRTVAPGSIENLISMVITPRLQT